jgi:hypothetical protein
VSRFSPYRETPPLHMRPSKPISVPPIQLAEIPDHVVEEEARAAQSRIIERRTIREGLDCWREIGRAESYEHWKKIGAALSIGKQWALLTVDLDAPWHQRRYGAKFSKWLQAHGFDAMRPSDRSDAITLFENREAIDRWRATLSEKQRRRLRGCQQNVKRWRKESGQPARRDDVTRALVAWQCFIARVKALPPEQAAAVWQQTVMAEGPAIANAA